MTCSHSSACASDPAIPRKAFFSTQRLVMPCDLQLAYRTSTASRGLMHACGHLPQRWWWSSSLVLYKCDGVLESIDSGSSGLSRSDLQVCLGYLQAHTNWSNTKVVLTPGGRGGSVWSGWVLLGCLRDSDREAVL